MPIGRDQPLRRIVATLSSFSFFFFPLPAGVNKTAAETKFGAESVSLSFFFFFFFPFLGVRSPTASRGPVYMVMTPSLQTALLFLFSLSFLFFPHSPTCKRKRFTVNFASFSFFFFIPRSSPARSECLKTSLRIVLMGFSFFFFPFFFF